MEAVHLSVVWEELVLSKLESDKSDLWVVQEHLEVDLLLVLELAVEAVALLMEWHRKQRDQVVSRLDKHLLLDLHHLDHNLLQLWLRQKVLHNQFLALLL
jgi:hypothetical protein